MRDNNPVSMSIPLLKLEALRELAKCAQDNGYGSDSDENDTEPDVEHEPEVDHDTNVMPEAGDSQSSPDSPLLRLKQTATRLKLATRRPSYVAFREKFCDKPLISRRPYTIHESTSDWVELTDHRKAKVQDDIEWLKEDLLDMKMQDKALAGQLLSIRKEIHSIKLQKSCEAHEELLEDCKQELKEIENLSELCDYPIEELGFYSGPLKHIGVTKLNLNSRRFSTC